ncbi:ammonium transporter AmtB-like domain-containing protein [Pelagophyceae sp. CCMP2097]|nr:ammonium transporter AmtB-like domain-containing protein [Pelagophyceae sp. CCMP2097]|mmetsp:Transcript_3551/g.10772  ORF Transcript_3551/g.10772 Transcript_3551/m.10772 type:complete len:489 (+) Transcript_3551:111-1577(+)
MASNADLEALIAGLQTQMDTMGADLQQQRRLDENFESDMNAFWLIFGGVLVFWMQAGFAMLEVGTVHKKNTKNILVKNFFDASIASLTWWATGNALAGGGGDEFVSTGDNGFVDTNAFLAVGSTGIKGHSEASWFFAYTFAGATATIVSGAVAERCSFTAYICYAVALSGFVYPPVVHMMWGTGKFSAWREVDNGDGDDQGSGRLVGDCGVIDFAGSGTVHMTGGVAALVAAAFVGPRKGRWDPGYVLPYGNPVYQALGVFILWTGWYGFNAVSTLQITGGYGAAASHVVVTTTIAAGTACLSCTAVGYLKDHIIDPSKVNNGILAGLVSITSPCSTCNYLGAFLIGLIAGPLFVAGSALVKLMKVDDVVDAVAVHGICGMWGVFSAALFATPYFYGMSYYSGRKDDCAGLFFGGDGGSMIAALAAIGAIFCWVGGTMSVLFGTLKVAGLLRVTEEVEDAGMDDSKHGGCIPEAMMDFPAVSGKVSDA